METLDTFLKACAPQLPIFGEHGYAGEQDGTSVIVLGVLYVASRKEAQKITIGKAIQVHWAHYTARHGWKVCLAHWSDADEEDCRIKIGTGTDAGWL